MLVYIIGRGVPTREYPQNGVFEFDQAKAIFRQGVKTVYIAVDSRSLRRKRKWGLVYKKKESFMPIYSINIPLGPIPIGFRLQICRFIMRIAFNSITRIEGTPDIIHCQFGTLGYISTGLMKHHIPIVITEHSSEMNTNRVRKELLYYVSKGYENASRVIAVSGQLANNIESNTGIKAVVIGNIVDIKTFINIHPKAHNCFAFVTASNLTEIKQINLLIDAFKTIYKNNKNVHLWIIGDGEERNKLEEQVKKLNITHVVSFLGRKSRREIAKVYEKCDCYIMVSKSETFGVAYAEAILAGLPVIASNNGGANDFVNDENGLLINPDNPDEIKEAMEYMLNHHNKYDKQKMRKRIERNFSGSVIAKDIIGLYKEVLKNP